MNADIEAAKAAIKKEHAAELMRRDGLSFPAAWARATREHPELDESFDEHPSSMPSYTPPLPGQVAADQAKLDQLLRKLNMPRKVEAKKPPREDDGELVLVMASSGEVIGLEFS